jgi:hypothetical protein
MGLAPMHFFGAATPGLDPQVLPASTCSQVWFKYDWQDFDRVSHHQIAQLIQEAEAEIAAVVGYWPGPYWTEEELHTIENGGPYGAASAAAFALGSGKLISPGVRTVELVAALTVAGGSLVYSDEDGDGYYETATLTVSTSLTNVNQIKVFHTGFGGAAEWEIRPARRKTLSGGVATLVFDSILFIDPELYESYPTSAELGPIDVSTVSSFVTTVDVYREYADTTLPAAVFYWGHAGAPRTVFACPNCGIIGGSTGCSTCTFTTQDGCLTPRDYALSLVSAYPATYDEDTGLWNSDLWAACAGPGQVKVHYLSGDQSPEFLQGRSTEPLSHTWAQIITWLATARLERPLCGCGSAKDQGLALMEDLSLTEGGRSHFLSTDVLESPFGTRRGEVMAWRRLKKAMPQRRFRFACI